jgi:hypothetical protein
MLSLSEQFSCNYKQHVQQTEPLLEEHAEALCFKLGKFSL